MAPFEVVIERGKIREFCLAIGDPNPLFLDPAGKVGYRHGENGAEQAAPEIVVDYTDTANFLIDVNLTAQQVTVLYKNVAIKNMVCSGGKPETPRISTECAEPYRRGIGQGFGSTEDGEI